MPETEHAPRETEEQHEAYFRGQLSLVDAFWSRFTQAPQLDGAHVAELGCGHGALSVAMAQAGAAEVVGVDLDADRVGFASRFVPASFPELADRVSFRCADISELAAERPGSFDLAVSKDTMEHVQDLDRVLLAVHALLKPGGAFWIGFSPLWGSPKGDHGRTGLRAPWAHALLPGRLVLRQATRHRGYPVHSLADIGLNGYAPSDYVAAFARSGLEVERIAYNRSEKLLVRALDRLRRLRPLERFATVGMYAVLRRPAGESTRAAA